MIFYRACLAIIIVIELVICSPGVCDSQRCIKKCCHQNEVMIIQETTGELSCGSANVSMSHPVLVSDGFEILFNKSCDFERQYAFPGVIIDDNITFFENATIHYPMFGQLVPLFEYDDFCVDHFNGQPGVMVCVDKETVPQEERRHIQISK
ncbi:unnamed protein product [Ceutorhynchus assimilis]|uniref:Uncharacterized protein n=1 Tax=Ceutorhynchus assimilis TaxID=467358 RepID=A0A9N9MFD0_9CUCU|nr:unnamed protein product [Ceutorhynchus assimilis]